MGAIRERETPARRWLNDVKYYSVVRWTHGTGRQGFCQKETPLAIGLNGPTKKDRHGLNMMTDKAYNSDGCITMTVDQQACQLSVQIICLQLTASFGANFRMLQCKRC